MAIRNTNRNTIEFVTALGFSADLMRGAIEKAQISSNVNYLDCTSSLQSQQNTSDVPNTFVIAITLQINI